MSHVEYCWVYLTNQTLTQDLKSVVPTLAPDAVGPNDVQGEGTRVDLVYCIVVIGRHKQA